MAFSSLLKHMCAIQRRVNAIDRFGQPAEEWEDVLVNVPCRLSNVNRQVGEETTTVSGRDIVEKQYELYIDAGIPVDEGYQIRNVRDANENVLVKLADVVAVRRVSDRSGAVHHLELMIREKTDAEDR